MTAAAMARQDSVATGGGPDALVCAVDLARAGWRPLVLEAADHLGREPHAARALAEQLERLVLGSLRPGERG